MDKVALSEKVFGLLADTLHIDKSSIRLDSKLAELSEDSIQLFEVVLTFEKEFKLQATYEELIRIITVEDIVEYLSGKVPNV